MKQLKLIGIMGFLMMMGAGLGQAEEKMVVYPSGQADQKLEGFLALPKAKGGAHPGVLVVHDWAGLTDRTKEKARELAKLGYVAFAVDIYGQGQHPKTREEMGQLAGKFKTDRVLFRERLNAGLQQLLKFEGVDAKRVAAIGFCFGGTGVIELARSGAEVRGVVSFHGGLDSPETELGRKIKGKVLVLHGADDPFEKAEDLAAFENEMRVSKVDWQLVKFGGAVHSFTDKSSGTDNSKGAAYNESADRRSWALMKSFFSELF